MSGVLGTAEHAMAAAGSLLKDKGDAFDELKSLLSHSLRGSAMGDLPNISCLLDRIKLDKVLIRRSCEAPRYTLPYWGQNL
jgi:hypothetical protein